MRSEVDSESRIAIVGASGCGKSRFCLGAVKLGEEKNKFVAQEGVRYGYVPTRPDFCFSYVKETLKGELELSLQFNGQRIQSIEKIARAYGVEQLLYRDPLTLSGGEKVRAAICLVAATQPHVVVLDQVFDWVDVGARREIRSLLSGSRGSGKIRIEAHNIAPDQRGECDQFWPVSEGRMFHARNYVEARSIVGKTVLEPGYSFAKGRRTRKNFDKQVFVSGLTFRYSFGGFKLGPVTFGCIGNVVVSLEGENGCGKSTLLKALGGLVSGVAGGIKIGNNKISADPLVRAQQTFYVFQDPDHQLYNRTVREELRETGRRFGASSEDVWGVIDALDLKDLLDADPFVLGYPYRRLVTLAVGLVAAPEMLLLDEPTAGLDGLQREKTADAMVNFVERGGAIFLISHDRDLVDALGDGGLRLCDGRIRSSWGDVEV